MKVAIIGAGRIGQAVWKYLRFVLGSNAGCDIFDTQPSENSTITLLSSVDQLEAYDVWIVATPFTENKKYIEAAYRLSKVYIDFTEDIQNRELCESIHGENLSSDPAIAFSQAKYIPMCGLAPGWVSIIAHGLAKQLDLVKSIDIRVGALPTSSLNDMKYALTWSPEGLVNEYVKDAEILSYITCQKEKVPSMTALESVVINGKEYEAFYTSGGIGTLIDTWLENDQLYPPGIQYKTLRYPGHLENISWYFDFGNFGNPKEIVEHLKKVIPTTRQDVVVVYIEVLGEIGGQLVVRNFVHEFYAHGGSTAIEITTAMGALIWLDYLNTRGMHNMKSLNKQEDMPFEFFKESFKSLYSRIYEKVLDMKLESK